MCRQEINSRLNSFFVYQPVLYFYSSGITEGSWLAVSRRPEWVFNGGNGSKAPVARQSQTMHELVACRNASSRRTTGTTIGAIVQT
jgi:hypothetical protein